MVALAVDDLKQLVATSEPADFVRSVMPVLPPAAFAGAPLDYGHFRSEVSSALGVHPRDLALVGSGLLGFSLNPDHLLSALAPGSDLDVAVVHRETFDQAWHDLLARETSTAFADVDEKKRFKRTRENFFHGCLRPDQMPLSADLSIAWFPKLAGPFTSVVAKSRPVEGFLFRTWDHFDSFYIKNLTTVRPKLRQMLKIEVPDDIQG